MESPVDPAKVPEARAVAAGGALGAVRAALSALVEGARAQRLPPGSLDGLRLGADARAAWLGGWAEALGEVPVIVLGVAPTALQLGDISLIEAPDQDVAETLHAAGARAIVLFTGVSEDELLLLARMLLTSWPAPGQGELDLETAQWGLDLPHVYFDLIGPGEGGAESEIRVPGRLRAEVGDPGASQDGGVQGELLDAALLAELRALREAAAPPDAASFSNPTAPHPVPIELAAEAAAVRTGGDLHPAAVSDLLLQCIHAEPGPERTPLFTNAAVSYALGLLGGPVSPGPVVHGLLELLDPDLTPDAPLREGVRGAIEGIARSPHRERLLRVLAEAGEDELRGELFSIFSFVASDEAVASLAEALPRWAGRILADALLVRVSEAGPSIPDGIRGRLKMSGVGSILVALAMAARVDDTRLLDPVLAHADHPDAGVREAVLFALRKQRSNRVREFARARLGDAAAGVRIEALRYCVAYRDVEAGPWLEGRLSDPALAEVDEAEVRAVCIGAGRLLREHAEVALLEIGIGRRRAPHPSLPRYAMHGLKAIGTARARSALETIAADVPKLRAEALALLAQDER